MSDYERIAQAISYINAHVHQQPQLEDVAAHLNLSPFHFQRLFSRWAGVSPKRYLQTLTVERAKQLLSESRPLLEVSDTLGLGSASRLYDHFVKLEAVTPGDYRKAGAGLRIDYAVQASPFGDVFIAVTPRGICKLAFIDGDAESHLDSLNAAWPRAVLRENHQSTATMVKSMFAEKRGQQQPLSLYVTGTNFQVSVWKALLQIPPGKVASYSQIASAVGRPGAARAVGSANARNPIAFLIPCHRVIRHSGNIGDYHWGETRKHAIHAWESARQE